MADYKRLVSYMYQYENGVKKRNVGYARVESKNGQCKITLHMQLPGQLDSIFPVYLIQRDNNELNLIYLGDSVLKSQVIDSKLAADEKNIMGSGYNLSVIGGILLFLNENVFFATEWDDKAIDAQEVMKALKPKAVKTDIQKEKEVLPENYKIYDNIKSPEEGVRPAKIVWEPKDESNAAVDMKTAATDLEEDIHTAAKADNSDPLMEELSIPKYKLPRGWKTVERLQDPKEYYKEQSKETDLPKEGKKLPAYGDMSESAGTQPPNVVDAGRPADTQAPDEEVAGKPADTKTAADTETADKEIISKLIEEGYADNDLINKFSNDETVRQANKNIEKMNLHQEEQDRPDPPMAAHIFESYPRIYPFEDNEITLCVKIEPKDIGYLSKDAWALSNNSFLLHGFYSYQHLIFAKIKDRFGCRYILGVPGIYHNRERFMARMFGFENFKSIRKRELKQGDFGYWYIPISM